MPLRFSDEELQAMMQERVTAPLSAEPVGFLGRAAASFADTPQGKSNILENLGIEGVLRDPVGPDWGDIADYAGDVPPAILSALGAAVGSLGRSPGVGAGVGGAAGEFLSQGIGNLLGSKEGVNEQAVASETMGGMAGEKLAAILPKAANPFRPQSMTSNIRENVLEPAKRFGLEEVLPPASRTQSDFIGRTQARIAGGADDATEEYLRGTRENFRQGQQDVLEGIANKAGVTNRAPRPGADDALRAAEGSREAREDLIGEMFDQARDAMGSTDFPVVVDETTKALRRMAGRRNAGTLSDFNVNSAAQKELARFSEDVGNIRTFEQMDAFRREVGGMLRNPARMEEMEKAGMDLDFRDLYGALKRDLETSLPEGKLAQEFGGQSRGQLGMTRRNPLGVETSTPNQGNANVSRMQEGVYGERDLPGFPGRESEVARGRVPGRAPTDADARSSTEMLDELSGRVENAQTLRDEASDRFADLVKTERSTIIRMLRDPGQAENIYSRLFRPSATVDNIRAFRQHIGAEPTPGGNPITKEGVEAWQGIQAQVMREIREAAEDVTANRLPGGAMPLDGKAMRRKLDSLGGEDILEESFGPEATSDLYAFADFIRESDPAKRSFNAIPERVDPEDVGIFFITILKKAGEWMSDKALKRAGFPRPGSVGSRIVTEGLAPRQGQQNMLRALGTAMTQPAISDALEVVGGTSR